MVCYRNLYLLIQVKVIGVLSYFPTESAKFANLPNYLEGSNTKHVFAFLDKQFVISRLSVVKR